MGNKGYEFSQALQGATRTWMDILRERRMQEAATGEKAVRDEQLKALKRVGEWEEGQMAPPTFGGTATEEGTLPATTPPYVPSMGTYEAPPSSPALSSEITETNLPSPTATPGYEVPSAPAVTPEAVTRAKLTDEQNKARDAFLKAPVQVTTDPAYTQFSSNSEVQDHIMKELTRMGAVDPKTGMGPRWKIFKALETLAKTEDFVDKTLVRFGKQKLAEADVEQSKIDKIDEKVKAGENPDLYQDKKKESVTKRDALRKEAERYLLPATELAKLRQSETEVDQIMTGPLGQDPMLREAARIAKTTGKFDLFNAAYKQMVKNYYKPDTTASPNLNIQDITDSEGNVTRIIADPKTGQEISRQEVGKIGRANQPPGNIYVGQTEGGGMVTMPTRGPIKLSVTEPPEGGLLPKNISEDYKKDVGALKNATDLVNELKSMWDGLGVMGGQRGRLHGVQLWGEAKAAKNKDAKTYLDDREAFLGNLSRSIAAERGVLTQQDIDRVARAMPKIGPNPLSVDNQEEADRKWGLVKTIVSNAEKRLRERYKISGKNPTGTENTPNKDPLGIR
jgi:hypothetical protein